MSSDAHRPQRDEPARSTEPSRSAQPVPRSSRTQRTQQQRASDTRHALLKATVDSLLELGFSRTTTLEVQRRAGVSRGALLHHFPSKAELLAASVTYLADLRGRELRTLAIDLPDGPARTDAALDLLWQSFSGSLFCVALELRNAARTDDDFRAVLIAAELDLRDRIVRQSMWLFGEAIATRPGFECALDITLQLMIGAAMSTALHNDPAKTKALVGKWKTIFPTLLGDQRDD